ncbi:efflux RND transporter periplasmic adaptor subunit [Endothiovibrio diazotrophicus]
MLSNLSKRKWIFFPLALLGAAVLVVAVKAKRGAAIRPAEPVAVAVQVHTVERTAIAPEVVGYGRVRPKVSWEAVAEVSGQVIARNPRLEAGRTLRAGDVLARIDPLEYQLKQAQAEADLASADGDLLRLDARRENAVGNREIQDRQVALAAKELKRMESLFGQKALSQSALEQQRSTLLAQQQKLAEIDNELRLIDADRAVSEAKKRIAAAKADDARRLLEKTVITLPFDARISEVNLEQDQVVKAGEVLVRAYRMEVMEVESQVALHEMRRLGRSLPGEFRLGSRPFEIGELGLTATVALNLLGGNPQWPARVTRVRETVADGEGSVGVVVEVEQKIDEVTPGKRPPLINGMFAEVHIRGVPQPLLTVPVAALHGGQLYLVDGEERLKVVPVSERFERDGLAAVEGIEEGARVVTTALDPVVPGTPLRVVLPDNGADNAEDAKSAENAEKKNEH